MGVGQVHVRWGNLPRRVALQIGLTMGIAVEALFCWKGGSGEPCSACGVYNGEASSLDLSADFCKWAFHGGLVPHLQNVLTSTGTSIYTKHHLAHKCLYHMTTTTYKALTKHKKGDKCLHPSFALYLCVSM